MITCDIYVEPAQTCSVMYSVSKQDRYKEMGVYYFMVLFSCSVSAYYAFKGGTIKVK